MKETLKLQGSEAFLLAHITRRIVGCEETMSQAALSLKDARQHHADEVKAELEKHGIVATGWSTRTEPTGTVFIDYEMADAPPPKRGKKSPPK